MIFPPGLFHLQPIDQNYTKTFLNQFIGTFLIRFQFNGLKYV